MAVAVPHQLNSPEIALRRAFVDISLQRAKRRHSVCGHDTIAILWIRRGISCGVKGEDLSCYLNKIQYVDL